MHKTSQKEDGAAIGLWNGKDRRDEGIDDGDAMMHSLTEGLNDRGAAEEDAILHSAEFNARKT